MIDLPLIREAAGEIDQEFDWEFARVDGPQRGLQITLGPSALDANGDVFRMAAFVTEGEVGLWFEFEQTEAQAAGLGLVEACAFAAAGHRQPGPGRLRMTTRGRSSLESIMWQRIAEMKRAVGPAAAVGVRR